MGPSDSSSHTPPARASSKVLSDLFCEVLEGVSHVASIVGNRRFGLRYSIGFQPSEAKRIADPISRLVQRRVNIRGELNDAADGAGAAAAFLAYIERVAMSRQSPPNEVPDFQPRRAAPAPSPEAPTPASSVPTRAPRHQAAEPGAGEVKNALLTE